VIQIPELSPLTDPVILIFVLLSSGDSYRHIARDLKSFCLFATHFHELTELEKSEPGIGNLHMAVSESGDGDGSGQSPMLLFEVRSGVSTRSYGINTAVAAGFPPELIRVSKISFVTFFTRDTFYFSS
jgi:DNA mismatch repair ATPase MutS